MVTSNTTEVKIVPNTKRLIVNLPAEIHQRLTDLAAREMRTLNAEATILLQEGMDRRDLELVQRGNQQVMDESNRVARSR